MRRKLQEARTMTRIYDEQENYRDFNKLNILCRDCGYDLRYAYFDVDRDGFRELRIKILPAEHFAFDIKREVSDINIWVAVSKDVGNLDDEDLSDFCLQVNRTSTLIKKLNSFDFENANLYENKVEY